MGISYTEYYAKEDDYEEPLSQYTSSAMCFGDVDWDQIKGITYHAKVDKDLTPAQVRWWVRNVRMMLQGGGLRYTVSPLRGTRRRMRMDIRIPKVAQNGSIGIYRNLLYLTAFRYIEYFPLIIRIMHRHRLKARGRAGFLRLLQQVSIDVQTGKGRYHDRIAAAHYMGDHDLVCPESQYGESSNTPITLARFRSNLRKGRQGVQAFFS